MEPYRVNLQKVSTAHKYPAVVKLLAREFIEGAVYFSLSTWLKQLSVYDLDMMIEISECLKEDETPENQLAGESIVLLTEMLVNAEGIESSSELATRRVGHLVLLLMCEKLYRQGLIEFDYNHVSFDEDEMDQTIAWRKGSPKPNGKGNQNFTLDDE
jgi:hypothetical protein